MYHYNKLTTNPQVLMGCFVLASGYWLSHLGFAVLGQFLRFSYLSHQSLDYNDSVFFACFDSLKLTSVDDSSEKKSLKKLWAKSTCFLLEIQQRCYDLARNVWVFFKGIQVIPWLNTLISQFFESVNTSFPYWNCSSCLVKPRMRFARKHILIFGLNVC